MRVSSCSHKKSIMKKKKKYLMMIVKSGWQQLVQICEPKFFSIVGEVLDIHYSF